MKGKRWALVTGASSGFGWSISELLAEKGWNILGLARRGERLEKQAQALTQRTGTEFLTLVCDVRDRGQTKAVLEAHAKTLSQCELLVNNAGLAKGMEPLWEGKFEDWDQMLDTNVKGLLNVSRLVIPHMIQNNRGHIVNMGSVAGRWTYPGGGVYAASKFAVRALSESLRMDLLGRPIRVTNIEPGMAETEFSEVRLGDAERAKKVYSGMKPLTGQDVAEAVLWAVERPAHVNIQEIVIFPTDQAAIHMVSRKP